MIIWIGYFNTILEGCFRSEFQKGGIIEYTLSEISKNIILIKESTTE